MLQEGGIKETGGRQEVDRRELGRRQEGDRNMMITLSANAEYTQNGHGSAKHSRQWLKSEQADQRGPNLGDKHTSVRVT